MARETSGRMLTTSGVARILNLHVNTVRRWSNQGILRPYRIGPRGDRRFARKDIADILRGQSENLPAQGYPAFPTDSMVLKAPQRIR